MPFRKIKEPWGVHTIEACRDPEHYPPTAIVLEPGYYEHSCPTCGYIQHVRVPPKPTMEDTYVR